MKKILIGLAVVGVIGIGIAIFLKFSEGKSYQEVLWPEESAQITETEIRVESESGLSVEDCTSLEQYDESAQTCFFTCADEAMCADIEEAIDLEIAQSEEDYLDDQDVHITEIERSEDFDAIYDVQKGETITLVEGIGAKEHVLIWEAFAEYADDNISDQFISQYGVYDNNKSDTTAYVELVDDTQNWGLYINIAHQDEGFVENVTTYIHEFAHILTLNEDEIDVEKTRLQCDTFFTSEGCAYEQSYIAHFVQQFWSEEDIAAITDLESDGANPVFEADPDRFVNLYAATNPGEDIAESFAHFVLIGRDNIPTTIAGQKISFFYRYQELVEARENMRKNLAPKRQFKR